MPKLSNVAYVILGFLETSEEPQSGYDLKQHVDKSTRFFFASSYGQIYPELGRLAERGLIAGTEQSQGRRARVLYELTDAGRKELDDWLRSPGVSFEMRDEGLLKLFFSGDLEPAALRERVAEIRAARAGGLETLHAIQDEVGDHLDPLKQLVLDYGKGLHEWAVSWCDEADRRIDALERDLTPEPREK